MEKRRFPGNSEIVRKEGGGFLRSVCNDGRPVDARLRWCTYGWVILQLMAALSRRKIIIPIIVSASTRPPDRLERTGKFSRPNEISKQTAQSLQGTIVPPAPSHSQLNNALRKVPCCFRRRQSVMGFTISLIYKSLGAM